MGRTIELPSGEVHIWAVRVSPDEAGMGRLGAVLSPEENERAGRFRSAQSRDSYVATRAALRRLLANYLDELPQDFRFTYTPSGKPWLENTNLRFNVSHSGDLAVLAFCFGRELGIDVEQIRPLPDFQGVLDRVFCPEERSAWEALDAEKRDQAFYLCWTRKEAYLKARGQGLARRLDDFCVTLQPGAEARFLHIGGDASEAERWTLHDLQLADEYAAALAYEGHPMPVTIYPATLERTD